jgi:GAF domain-containing protein
MALTAKRREELAAEIDTFATWISHAGRRGRIRAVAAELRGEEVDGEAEEQAQARLAAAEQSEQEAKEVKASRRP